MYECGCNYLIQIPPVRGCADMTSLYSDYINFSEFVYAHSISVSVDLISTEKFFLKMTIETVSNVII